MNRHSGIKRTCFATTFLAVVSACLLCFGISTSAWAEQSAAPDGNATISAPRIVDTIPARTIHDDNESVCPNSLSAQADMSLPASYSSVDAGFVTPVRDQGPFGTCWAFSTIAALESSLLAHGQVACATDDGSAGDVDSANSTASSIDLSERHLAYFTYHAPDDPLGYTKGDTTTPGIAPYMEEEAVDTYLGAGGNSCMAAYTLASWRGAASEESAPYDELTSAYERYLSSTGTDGAYSYDHMLDDTALSPEAAYRNDLWHLTGIRQIALSDAADVKRAIVDNGAAAVLIYFDSEYYNYDTNSYYYYGHPDTNHGVTIVGWDDDYPAENFPYNPSWASELGIDVQTKTRAPAHDGAWLVKNSVGSWWGDGGYFWLSYDDACRTGRYSKAYVFEAAPATEFDNLYQHDGSTSANWNYVRSGGSIANVFTACAHTTDTTSHSAQPDQAAQRMAETLEAVSFALDDVNVDYSVQVYLNPRDPSDPTSGSPALAQPVVGKTSNAGYYTVPLPVAIPLAEGTVFSVAVTLSHGDNSLVAYSVDVDDSTWNWVTFHGEAHEGESFERYTATANWGDLARQTADSNARSHCVARVKALTRDVAASGLPTLSLDEAEIELDPASTVFAGIPVEPAVTVRFAGGTLMEGVDYAVSYEGNAEPGTGLVVVTGMGAFGGTISAPFEITPGEVDIVKAANPMRVSANKQVVKYSKLKRKAVKLSAINVTGAAGTVSFAKAKGSSSSGPSSGLSVSKKSGTIRVKKGLARGLYKIRVKVRASGDDFHAPASKTVTCKVRVR